MNKLKEINKTLEEAEMNKFSSEYDVPFSTIEEEVNAFKWTDIPLKYRVAIWVGNNPIIYAIININVGTLVGLFISFYL